MTANVARRVRLTVTVDASLVAATAVAASAQVVHNPVQPSRPGESVEWRLELPAEWGVETVTFDPLGFGLDSFVKAMYRDYWQCPASASCWFGSVTLDDRLQPGERAVTFTATGGGRSRTVTG